MLALKHPARDTFFGGKVIHNLSKRTALYADLGRIQNRGLSQLAIPGGNTVGSNFGVVADRNSTTLALGVRQSF